MKDYEDVSYDVYKRVEELQAAYTCWLDDSDWDKISIVPAGVLKSRLYHIQEYINEITNSDDGRTDLPVSMGWIAEQIIGAMYEYRKLEKSLYKIKEIK